MPQIISAYGRDYEFPDSMSDDAIRAAIQRDKPSVADTARARLSDRGLTPEAVKAGQGITSPSEIQFAPSKSVNGGFIGGLVSNPLAGVVDSVKEKIAAGHGPLVPLEMAAELTIPNIPAIAKESYRRGEANESTADMYGQVAQGALWDCVGHYNSLCPNSTSKNATRNGQLSATIRANYLWLSPLRLAATKNFVHRRSST